MKSETGPAPSWELAILFWRKVLAVEIRGIPGSRGSRVVRGLEAMTPEARP